MIPTQPHPDTSSQAELRLFTAWAEQLGGDYTVFHSVTWQLRSTDRGLQDGETDFLVVHPDFGILIVEVKGGRIRYDGEQDQWYTYDQPIKDPFKQGRHNKYSLLEKFKELSYWRNRWITVGYAVAFPDAAVKGDLKLDAPRELILDATDMTRLAAWVEQSLNFLRGRQPNDIPPGQNGVAELVKILSPSFNLPPLLSVQITAEGREQARLTQEQYTLLQFLGQRRRVAISGCAGSGKTMLAYEKARRLAEQEFKVLLTCFNAKLSQWLRLNSEESRPPNLYIANFHHMADKVIHLAGLSTGPHTGEYFKTIQGERLTKAIDQIGSQFDAIVVDEGQDLDETMWFFLQCLLHDPDHGILYVFFDGNQNIYQATHTIPLETAPYTLPHNCRNTQAIHRQVLTFYHADDLPTAIGPAGRPIEHHSYANDNDLRRELRRVLHRLVVEEKVPPEDIVLLTPKARQRSRLWELGALGNFRLTEEPYSEATDEIFCATVHSFKGLERPVVILAEIDNDSLWNMTTILYVGCSRAANHLVILSATDLSAEIVALLPLKERVGGRGD
jgi:hypothetical protein